jgi:hypothetical protein
LDVGGWTSNISIFKMIAKSRGAKFRSSLDQLILEIPEGSRIKDFEKDFEKEENGVPIDGYGKLLWNLKLHQE